MEKISGVVNRIIYSTDNGFVIAEIISEGEEITVKGSLIGLRDGAQVELEGNWVDHPTYGRQFQSNKYTEIQPQDEMSIERYLGSGAISGVGLKMAARIVRHFGKETLNIIEREPERLAEIKGISMKKALDISAQIEAGKNLREAMMYLQDLGISINMAGKIYNHYHEQIFTVLKNNPYRLADEIEGIGFKRADEIAARAGIPKNNEHRIKSGIVYVLSQAAAEGHTYILKEQLIERATKILEVDNALLEKCMIDLVISHRIAFENDEAGQVTENTRVYSSVFFNMENRVAQMLHALNGKLKIGAKDLEKTIKSIEKNADIELEGLQRKAVETAAQYGLLIVTGGPGTGKTTTIDAIIKLLEYQGLEYVLAAPTGRAAKRMSEATGVEAKTIHRLLEVGQDGGEGFGRDESYPLEADAIIIDEMSMVDLPLMYALLRAILPGTRLILVGDANQLPSVGPGRVLHDIIESGEFPVVKLTEIFRQAKESDIVMNAHHINSGDMPDFSKKSKDFFFLKRTTAEESKITILQLVMKNLPPNMGITPADVQVLSPMKKGILGVTNLNIALQYYINPPAPQKAEFSRGGATSDEDDIQKSVFREGDKVMQIKNNYNLEWEIRGKYGIVIENGRGVFNGDVGVIKTIDNYTKIVTVEFEDNKQVDYSFADMEELELAYATTIHKSQGSEYKAVVIPIFGTANPLQNRNLIYTAVTRAKEIVVIVGSEEEFKHMVSNADSYKRNSGLIEKIKKGKDAFIN